MEDFVSYFAAGGTPTGLDRPMRAWGVLIAEPFVPLRRRAAPRKSLPELFDLTDACARTKTGAFGGVIELLGFMSVEFLM